MKKIVFLALLGSFLFGDGLDIYTDRVMVEKTSKDGLFTVPFELDMSQIEISSGCDISDAYFTNFRKEEDKNSAKRELLSNRLKALRDGYEIIRNSKSDRISDIDDLLTANLTEQSAISSELSLLSSVGSEAFLLKDLVITAPCEEISIKYPSFRVALDSRNIVIFKDDKITIKQNANILNLDENLTNARIRFFPYSVNYSQKPALFTPIYLQKEPVAQVADAPATMMATDMMLKTKAVAEAAPSSLRAVEQTIHTFNFWQIDGANLRAKKDNLLVLNTQEVNATFSNFIDGYGTSRAYFKVSFTPDYDIQVARTDYYFDDKFIQSGYPGKILKDSESSIYFGINNFIDVKKEISDINTDESLFGGKETTKNSWHYEIKNNSDKSQTINFVERLPVSTHQDIKVVMLGDIKNEPGKDGRVELNFTLLPNETKEFKFGYAVTKPVK